MGDEYDPPSRGHSRFQDTDYVWNGQATEQWPHGEVLEARWGCRELVAQSIVLHINADEVIQAWSWKAQYPGDFLCVEQVCGLVPMNPHATEVVTKKVV